MRRGFASMLMGLSLLLASFSWAGFVLSSTVLDPRGSTRLVSETMDHESVRSVLTSRLADGLARIVPESEPLSRQDLEQAAAETMTDPKARAAVTQALVEAHLLGLQGGTRDDFFSAFDVNVAGREAVVSARPSLRRQILANPLVELRLPVSGLNWLSGLRELVDRFAVLAAAAAMIGFATTFVVARDPEQVIRRAAWWVLGSAAAWTVVGLAYGAVARIVVPSSYVVLAVAVERFFAAMEGPAIAMISFGLGLLSMSFLVPALRRRHGGALLARASRQSSPGLPLPPNPGAASIRIDTTDRPDADPAHTGGSSASASRDAAAHDDSTDRPLLAESNAPSVARRMSAAWLEGHGYLDDARVAPFLTSGPAAESTITSLNFGRAAISGQSDPTT